MTNEMTVQKFTSTLLCKFQCVKYIVHESHNTSRLKLLFSVYILLLQCCIKLKILFAGSKFQEKTHTILCISKNLFWFILTVSHFFLLATYFPGNYYSKSIFNGQFWATIVSNIHEESHIINGWKLF